MKPIRILQVVGALNRGGVETWLMHILRHIDRRRFRIDFLVHTGLPSAYDRDVLGMGCRILRCPNIHNPLSYARQFLRLIEKHGPFDVLHSHVHHFSGFVLALGRLGGIPVRVAHSHNDTAAIDSKAHPARKLYLETMRRLIQINCTQAFAVSQPAGAALLGNAWQDDRRASVLYCGIDLGQFRAPDDLTALRTELGFSREDMIYGHVGRFDAAKNHGFLLHIAARLVTLQPTAKFLLVGDGGLRAHIQHQTEALGLKSNIVFAGLRSDIPALMRNAMDVFLLPSIHEGVPLVLMEAQAAALPCIVSDVVTDEAVVNPALVQRLPLSAGPESWAQAAHRSAQAPRFDKSAARELVENSRFNIRHGIEQLCQAYCRQAGTSEEGRRRATPQFLQGSRSKGI